MVPELLNAIAGGKSGLHWGPPKKTLGYFKHDAQINIKTVLIQQEDTNKWADDEDLSSANWMKQRLPSQPIPI